VRRRRSRTKAGFAAQLANDLRNPLAAIRGAAQWLAEDSRRGAHSEEHRALALLVIEQVDRLGRVVGAYERTPIELAAGELRALAERVAESQ
jgi:nitrogen-specific signal transduction histidine kinase